MEAIFLSRKGTENSDPRPVKWPYSNDPIQMTLYEWPYVSTLYF